MTPDLSPATVAEVAVGTSRRDWERGIPVRRGTPGQVVASGEVPCNAGLTPRE